MAKVFIHWIKASCKLEKCNSFTKILTQKRIVNCIWMTILGRKQFDCIKEITISVVVQKTIAHKNLNVSANDKYISCFKMS